MDTTARASVRNFVCRELVYVTLGFKASFFRDNKIYVNFFFSRIVFECIFF